MERNFAELINDTELIDLTVVHVDPKQLEYERAIEIVSQSVLAMLEQCLIEFPAIDQGKVGKCVEEVNKFLSFHEASGDRELVEYIGKGLQKSVMEYHWKEQIRQK